MNYDDMLKEFRHSKYSKEELKLLKGRIKNDDPTLTLDENLELTRSVIRRSFIIEELYKKERSGILTESEMRELNEELNDCLSMFEDEPIVENESSLGDEPVIENESYLGDYKDKASK